ncbi:MAG: ArsR family transcriptional regulator [Chloroflexi bacterium]|nr:MAG: ArsR family transcriptional regulator [Chloroflexota bacterium]
MPHQWTFLTNHSHVLICVAQDPDSRLADIATRVGITERATLAIIRDLVDEGYIARTRVGRRNQYRVNGRLHLRHAVERRHRVGELIELLADENGG